MDITGISAEDWRKGGRIMISNLPKSSIETQRRTQVAEQMFYLEETTNNLRDKIAALRDRLTDILAVIPSPGTEAPKSDPPVGLCKLAERLYNQVALLEAVVRDLNDLFNKLEI